jgi:hypothetical protein
MPASKANNNNFEGSRSNENHESPTALENGFGIPEPKPEPKD